MTEPRPIPTIDRPVDATVAVPGSKSIANRMLVCAALAEGTSRLSNVPDGDDTRALIDCLARLGLDAALDDGVASVSGVGTSWPADHVTLWAGLAGTTSRFVTALAALGSSPITIDGHPPLRGRPFGPLHDALGQLGAEVTCRDRPGGLPATVRGPAQGGTARLPGDVSSQFVSALMLIAPYLPDGLTLELTSPLVSRPYVELTAQVMAWFGVDDVDVDARSVVVAPARYRSAELAVEPDASSASYPLALAALTSGRVTVPGLGAGAVQGDARFADLLEAMGCRVERTPGEVTVVGTGRLSGIDVDMADISDLVPTVAVVAAFADSPSTIRGVGFIRAKESDRLGDLAGELRSTGADVGETDDGLVIRPVDRLRGAVLGTHHDHRLAMAFGVLGSVVEGVRVADPDVVSKSWPGFWRMLDESFR